MRRSASSRPTVARWARNDSTRLSESIKKSAGPPSPASPARNLAAGGRLSSDRARLRGRQPGVGDHAAVAPPRRAGGENVGAVMRAAPGGHTDIAHAERRSLAYEEIGRASCRERV